MVKHTQTIADELLTNCLSVFAHLGSCHFSLCCIAILVFSSSLKVLVLKSTKESFEYLHKFVESIMECKLLKQVKFIDMKQGTGLLMVIMKFMQNFKGL